MGRVAPWVPVRFRMFRFTLACILLEISALYGTFLLSDFVLLCNTIEIKQEQLGAEETVKKLELKKIKLQWRKILTVLFLVAIILGITQCFTFNGVNGIRQAITNNDVLSNVYYITQIFTSVAVVVGGIVGVWQYSLTSRAERAKMNTDCIQRAIDLAEYYKNNILKKYVVVQYVYKQSGLMDIVHKINSKDLLNFDKKELYELLTKADINEIEKIRETDTFIRTVIEADKIYNLNFNLEKNAKIEKNVENGEVAFTIQKGIIIQKFMGNIVTEILNNLEYFAMHFTHETADESVVYQSLHQTYLIMVYVLYYNIAIMNEMDASKYYTNVIELYKNWNIKDEAEKKERVNAVRGYTSKGNVAKKI